MWKRRCHQTSMRRETTGESSLSRMMRPRAVAGRGWQATSIYNIFSKRTMISLITFFSVAAVGFAANSADEILSLPGWTGDFPSKQYSGYLNASETSHLHYWYTANRCNLVLLSNTATGLCCQSRTPPRTHLCCGLTVSVLPCSSACGNWRE